MEFLYEYGLFLAKVVTGVIAILILVAAILSLGARAKKQGHQGHVEVQNLNKKLKAMKQSLEAGVLPKEAFKQLVKQRKKEEKEAQKSGAGEGAESQRRRLFVLDFDGDIRASRVESFRHAVSSVLSIARPEDEVVVRLESAGGLVHSYGLAASQMQRIRDHGIPLTVCVDKVAASGGYMMACIANRILAAPFAIIGSIGVVAQLPNFHRLLKKHDIDYEVLTAGEYKRTLTIFGENTEKGRQKFLQDLEDTHALFKAFVAEHRPAVDIERVANGEIWFGRRALDQQLVDELMTSDEYLFRASESSDVYVVNYVEPKSISERLGMAASLVSERVFLRLWERLQGTGLPK